MAGASCARQRQQRPEHIVGLEAGDDTAHAVLRRQEREGLGAGDHAHVAGQDEAVERRLAGLEQCPQRRRHRLVQAEDGEVAHGAVAGPR